MNNNNNVISIGKAEGFARHIHTTFTEEGMKKLVDKAIPKATLNEQGVNIYLNLINQYIESGRFYEDFYFNLDIAIDKKRCVLVKDECNNTKLFIYNLEFHMIYLDGISDPRNIVNDIIKKYTVGLIRDEGYKKYINDILSGVGMELSFYRVETDNAELRFECEVSLTHGELYNALYRNYLKLTF